MSIAHAYTLLLEAAALAASFAMLWLSFWLRDRHRQVPQTDLASDQREDAKVVPLVLSAVAAGARWAIDLASSDVQPASEKNETILYRPEHAQYLNDKPQIQAEQEQRA